MSASKPVLAVVVAASLAAVGFALSSSAQDKPPALGDLRTNEGIFVDPASFAIMKGVAKTDPNAQIVKLGAKEVSNGAIIFRVGDKLYLADANIGQKSLLNAFWEEYDRSHTP
jgi:hypothetical protein